MGDRRPRRPPVDYSSFNFDDDDDDFVDSSSSSSSRGGSQEKQKSSADKKKEKKKSNVGDENGSKTKERKGDKKKVKKELKEMDMNEGLTDSVRTLESFMSSPSRRMERKSLDEKRFERELEMAMKLSKQGRPEDAERLLTDDVEIPLPKTSQENLLFRGAGPPADAVDDSRTTADPSIGSIGDHSRSAAPPADSGAALLTTTTTTVNHSREPIVKIERVPSSIVHVLPDADSDDGSQRMSPSSATTSTILTVLAENVTSDCSTVKREPAIVKEEIPADDVTPADATGWTADVKPSTTNDDEMNTVPGDTSTAKTGEMKEEVRSSPGTRTVESELGESSKTPRPEDDGESEDFKTTKRRSKRKSGDQKKKKQEEEETNRVADEEIGSRGGRGVKRKSAEEKKEDEKEKEDSSKRGRRGRSKSGEEKDGGKEQCDDEGSAGRGVKRKRTARVIDSEEEEEEELKTRGKVEKNKTGTKTIMEGRNRSKVKSDEKSGNKAARRVRTMEEEDDDEETASELSEEEEEDEENEQSDDSDFASSKKKKRDKRKKNSDKGNKAGTVEAKTVRGAGKNIATKQEVPSGPLSSVSSVKPPAPIVTPPAQAVSSPSPSTPKPTRKTLLSMKSPAVPNSPALTSSSTPPQRISALSSPQTPVTPRLAPLTPSSGRSPVILPPGKCNIASPASIKHGLSRNARIKPLLSCIERRNPPTN